MLIHVVERGDTLYSIARRYGVSVQRIISDNGLAQQPTLVVGQALIILVPQTVHTVQPGESLYSIASQYELSPLSLIQKNPELNRRGALQPGRQVAISFVGEQQRVASINGYAYPFINRDLLLHELPFLTDLTLFGYGFSPSGALIPINDRPLIELARGYGVSPILLLSSITEDGNFSGERASLLFSDTQLQNTVIANLLEVMSQNGYVGIDVDFEYVNPDDAQAFIAFLRNITEQMHSNGYRVNVDLAPKTSAQQRGLLYEAHDYAAIGEIADTVLLMTYEWGYTLGRQGHRLFSCGANNLQYTCGREVRVLTATRPGCKQPVFISRHKIGGNGRNGADKAKHCMMLYIGRAQYIALDKSSLLCALWRTFCRKTTRHQAAHGPKCFEELSFYKIQISLIYPKRRCYNRS